MLVTHKLASMTSSRPSGNAGRFAVAELSFWLTCAYAALFDG
jgi:hypothetical protein